MQPKRSPRFFCLVFLLLVFANKATCFAQSEDDDDDSDADRKPFASLILTFDNQGNADVSLWLDQEPQDWKPIQLALGQVLHCSPASFSTPALSRYETQSLARLNPEQRAKAQQIYDESRRRHLQGNCAGVLPAHGELVRGELNLEPLVYSLVDEGKQQFSLGAEYPKTSFEEHGSRGLEKNFATAHYLRYKFPLNKADPAPTFSLAYGYRREDVLRVVGLPLGFLLLPIGLMLWMRRAALKSAATDPTAAWFSYAKTLNWCVTGTLLIWFVARTSVQQGLQDLMDFHFGGTGWQAATTHTLITVVPPWLVYLACLLISYKVFVQVRGHDWTPREFIRNQVLEVGTVLFPLMFLFGGIAFFAEYRKVSVLLFFATYLSWTFLLRAKMKVTRMMPEALTTGELRDRIFELAAKCGVNIKQVFVMGAGRGQIANAYAAKNNIVMFTDYLLHRLTKCEVDAITAHELSHLRYNHPRKLAMMLVLGVILMPQFFRVGVETFASIMSIGSQSGSRDSLWSKVAAWPQLDFLLTIAGLGGFYLLARRFERIADEGSVKLTGDAEGLITALLKVGRLNLTPIQWGRVTGSMLTHPSTLRRIERLAKIGNVAQERLQQLLEQYRQHERLPLTATPNLGRDGDDRYLLPETENRALTTLSVMQQATNTLWIMILAHVLPPAVITYLVLRLQGQGELAISTYLAGALLTLGGYSLLTLWLGLGARRRTTESLAKKFTLEGIDTSGANSMPVGFAPGRAPRFYVSNYNWDAGFALLFKDRLVYVGDQIRFALKPAQISDLRLGQGAPGWWSARRIYVDWRDEENQRAGTFNLAVSKDCSIVEVKKQPYAFLAEMRRWQQNANVYGAVAANLSELQSPQLGEVTSQSPKAVMSPRKFMGWSILVAIVGFAVCALMNIPPWYMLSVVMLVRLYEGIPYWWYREPSQSVDSVKANGKVVLQSK
jgi:Zn-dependent protease with chaperone function